MNIYEEKSEIQKMLNNEIHKVDPKQGEMLDNVVRVLDEDVESARETDDIYTYSGQALNQQELFELSCREDVKLVLVAGPFGSGKTTLETMLYYIFLEGKNQRVSFCGSYTLPGFWRRSRKIMCNSGEPEPVVLRTSRQDKDWFLHLRVQDKSGKSCNLMLADLSGEIFTEKANLDDYDKLFQNMENVIIVVDGEKVSNAGRREIAYRETVMLLKSFLSKGIVTRKTKLQIICTKQDRIKKSENRKKIEEFWAAKEKILLQKYRNKVYSISFGFISALSIEVADESHKMESIICKCMEDPWIWNGEESIVDYNDELDTVREFEHFSVRR